MNPVRNKPPLVAAAISPKAGGRISNGMNAWVVSVSMGYGHQRTAYPLKDLAPTGAVIEANDYGGIPPKDRKLWEGSRKFYEFISRFQSTPFVGKIVFRLFDRLQRVLKFYPKRDLSRPTFTLKRIFSLIRGGWGKDLIEKLKQKPLPLITTFFTPAFMAESFHYPADIYCVIPDAAIARAWAPLQPQKSKLKYFAPTANIVERLMRYGVRKENIFLTGYPLPKENLGSEGKLEIACRDMGSRLWNLDPNYAYCYRYETLIREYVGKLPSKADHPFTVLFSIGGAGAQRDIAYAAARSLAEKIKKNKVRFIISVGAREALRAEVVRDVGDLGVEVLCGTNVQDYFKRFNEALHTTDILWTKPSELSFYAGLGIPLIIAPPLGSHEELNRDWLLKVGAGMSQEDPRYIDEWLFDYLKSGWFAEAAMQGFVEIEKRGTFRIEHIVASWRA